jgi:hypothetical protein
MERHARHERECRQQRRFVAASVRAVAGVVAVELQVAGEDYLNGYECACERWHDEDGRRSSFYVTPAGELPPRAAAPPPGYLGPRYLGPPHGMREQVTERAASPPPHREDKCYGPLASNPNGDEKFRKDRAAWYERTTGQKLSGSLAEQNEKCDVLARGFRADSTRSGRPGPSSSDAHAGPSSSGVTLLEKAQMLAAAEPCIECGRTGCEGECVPADGEAEYVWDDYSY